MECFSFFEGICFEQIYRTDFFRTGICFETLFHKHSQDPLSTVNIITFSSLLLYVQYHEQPVCTSLLFTLLFIKSQYTVFCFLFLYILLFFLHILLFFCTSHCFALFYFIAHFILISPFLTICMPLLCYLYNLYSYCFALSLSGPDSIAFHF